MNEKEVKFTGEFFVPGRSGERIEADHMERYIFACNYAKNKSVLDIACGAGYSAPLFIEAGANSYQGVDINEELIDYSNSTYGSENIKYNVGNICSFKNETTYDVITCFETIEHVDEYESALSNLYRLLKPGGLLLISSPNRPITSPKCNTLKDIPENEFHTQEFTPEELISLLKKYGFGVQLDSVFGQRQRIFYPTKVLRKIMRLFYGNPDKITSPVVTPLSDKKAPRYFVIIARKKDGPSKN